MPKRTDSTKSPAGHDPAGDNKKPSINARYACFRLDVKRSKIHRWGVFAGEDIPPRRKVIEYTGEKISRRETKRRAEALADLHYIFTLDNYWNLDGARGGSGAEFINHCCEPNVYASIQKGHILYMSARAIRAGEELTIDYRFGADEEEVKCGCGSPRCRGFINLPK